MDMAPESRPSEMASDSEQWIVDDSVGDVLTSTKKINPQDLLVVP